MSGTTFLAPLGIEARAIRRGAPGARIERLGMGPARATVSSGLLAVSLPVDETVVLLGLGGGLHERGRAGDVIVASSIQLLDGDDEIPMDGHESLLAAVRAAGIDAVAAPIVSAPRIIHGAEARVLAGARGALAVDMESFWCTRLAPGRPFGVVRVLSDVPGQDLLSFRTPPALVRALRTLTRVARSVAHVGATTVVQRSVEEADR